MLGSRLDCRNYDGRQRWSRSSRLAMVHRTLRFGPFELSGSKRVLWCNGVTLPLGGRAFDILVYLAERPGEVIGKNELINHVWSNVTVAEGSRRFHVAAIATALRDAQSANACISDAKV